jgi:hypothetical protein
MAGSGIRVFAAGEILTAAQVNGYLMDQTVTRFADAETRDGAFGGLGQPVLTEGRICYLDDVNLIQFFNGSSWIDSSQFTVGDGSITSAKIANLTIVDGDISASAAISLSKLATGALPSAITVTSENISNLSIVNDDVSASASIGYSKLNLATSIVNADVSASASIADTKLATIATAGKVSNSATTATSANTASAIVARDAAGKAILTAIDVTTVIETASISASASTGTINIDFSTNPTVYYTSNATANWTLNVRGTSGVTLNDTLTTGQIATVTFLATNGAAPYRPTVFQVDGVEVTQALQTLKWMGGVAPTTGNADSIDSYTLAIIKTGNAAFQVLASQSRFA